MPASTTNPLSARFGSVSVISLAQRQDRRNETKDELVRIAQDPSEIKFFIAIKPQDKGSFQSPGVRGAFESHFEVLSQSADKKDSSVLVLEDDVEFVRDFELQLGVIDQLPPDWDIIYLGHNYEKPKSMQDMDCHLRRCKPHEEFIGLHCYSVNGKALPYIVRQLRQFPINGDPGRGVVPMPVDGALNVIRRLSPSLKCFLVDPPLANQRSSRTDIADLKWFDRSKILERPVSTLRRIKNKLRN